MRPCGNKSSTKRTCSHCCLTFLSFQMGAYFSLQACMSLPLRPEEVELLELGGLGGPGGRGEPVESSAPYWVPGGSEGGVGVVGYSMQACYQVATPVWLLAMWSSSLPPHVEPRTRDANRITLQKG